LRHLKFIKCHYEKRIYLSSLLIVDQVSKIYIKTNFVLGEEVEVLNGSKFYLLKMKEWHGVLKFQEPTVKFLTLFRLVAGGIGYWLWDSVEKKHSSNYLIVAVALILAGALEHN
jgi:signal peptidase II